jgi:hypothetical protein
LVKQSADIFQCASSRVLTSATVLHQFRPIDFVKI